MKLIDLFLIALVIAAVVAAIIVWRKNKSCGGDCSRCASSSACKKEDREVVREVPEVKTEEPVTVAFEVSEELPPIDPKQSRTTDEYLEFQQQTMGKDSDNQE